MCLKLNTLGACTKTLCSEEFNLKASLLIPHEYKSTRARVINSIAEIPNKNNRYDTKEHMDVVDRITEYVPTNSKR